MLKTFLISLGAFLVLDFVWLGFVVKKFNLDQLQSIGRISNGNFDVVPWSVGVVYLLMALLMALFVAPKLSDTPSVWLCFAYGAAMGLGVYGIFDFTNYAILKDYPLTFAFVDVAWGTFLFGATAAGLKLLSR